MSTKTQRALRRTLIWGLLFSLPLLYLAYSQRQYGADTANSILGNVSPFYLVDESGQGVSLHDLRQRTSLVLLLPAGSSSLAKVEQAKLTAIEAWAAAKLHERLPTNPSSYQLLVLSPPEGSPAWPGWRSLIAEEPEDLAAFLPRGVAPGHGRLVLIDDEARIRALYDLDELSLPMLASAWSKLSFGHYLSSYLEKRTFFGPRRS